MKKSIPGYNITHTAEMTDAKLFGNIRKIRVKRAERLFKQSAALRRKSQHYLTLSA